MKEYNTLCYCDAVSNHNDNEFSIGNRAKSVTNDLKQI